MPGNELRHLEHRDFAFAAEQDFELVVGQDVALVFGVLQIVLFYIHPNLLYHFAARHRTFAYDFFELRRKLHRL